MAYAVDWVDAFSDRAFGGNGCAVIHDDGGLTDETCIAIVRETSLVECTFVGPSDVADVKVRYFVATHEIPFAGHPTIATVASLVDRGVLTGDHATLETGAGVIPVEIDRSGGAVRIAMTQIAPVFGAEMDADLVAGAVGLRAADIALPPQIVSTGLPFCIALLRDHDAMARARMNPEGHAAFLRAAQALDHGVLEAYFVTLGGATPEGDTFARLLLAPPMPPEDPFTGSATGAAAAYLFSRDQIGARYVAEQGHVMGRPGQAEVTVLGTRDAITGVRVAGHAHILIRGEIDPG